MRETLIPRRDFLKISGLATTALAWWHLTGQAIAHAESVTGPETALSPEQTRPTTIMATRSQLDLKFASWEKTAHDFVAETNELWREFALDHDRLSPAVIEATYTKFGASAIAWGQLKIVTTELRRQIEAGQISPAHLTPEQSTLLRIRQAVDDANLENTIALNSPDFEPAFQAVLTELGFEGVIALKSPQDLGRTGQVFLWNRLSESWSDPIKVVVLNTAQYETWVNLKDSANELAGLDLTYDHAARWMIELSDEVVAKGACAYDQSHSTSTWARYLDDTVPASFELAFPTYAVAPITLHPRASFISENLADLLAQPTTQSPLGALVETLPTEISFVQNDVNRTLALTPDTFVSHLLHQWATQERRFAPIFGGADRQQLRAAMLQSANVPENRNGLPMSKYLLFDWAQLAFQAGILDRKILTKNQDISTLPPTLSHALISIEDYSQDTHLQLKNLGLLINDDRQTCLSMDEANQLISQPLTQLLESATLDQPMVRVVLYFAKA